MAEMGVTERAQEYVDAECTYVDVRQCVSGSHARAIKSGGIVALKMSIQTDGYRLVHTFTITLVDLQAMIPLLIHTLCHRSR
jgi:hypothetical protein